jgi:outer membrane protein
MRRDRLRLAYGAAVFSIPLLLPACATDELNLAPRSPAEPWHIPGVASDSGLYPFLPAATQRGDGINETSGTNEKNEPSNAEQPAEGDRSQMPAKSAMPTIRRENEVSVDPKRHYELGELIDLAQRSNPETHEAWEKARQAALGVGLVESAYAPQISAEVIGGYQHTPLPIPANLISKGYFTSDTRELLPTLALKWLLFDFGRRASAEEAARANSFVANVTFNGAHQKLIFAVSRDYFALGAARGKLRVAEQAVKNATVVQDAVDVRRAQGLATVVEVAQARRQLAEARFNLERARGSESAAYQELIASMGIASPAPIAVADSAQLTLPAMPGENVDRFVQEALSNRPDLIAAAGKVRAAEANLEEKRADYYPTISLAAQGYQNIGGLSTEGSRYYTVNEPGGSVLLQLSWSLFDGGAREARTASARSEIAAARDSLNQARDVTVKQVTNAYEALKTSLAEHQAAIALREAARTAYDGALDAYHHGVGTYIDLVHDETALTQADSEFEDSRADAFSTAAALAFSTGAILNDRN